MSSPLFNYYFPRTGSLPVITQSGRLTSPQRWMVSIVRLVIIASAQKFAPPSEIVFIQGLGFDLKAHSRSMPSLWPDKIKYALPLCTRLFTLSSLDGSLKSFDKSAMSVKGVWQRCWNNNDRCGRYSSRENFYFVRFLWEVADLNSKYVLGLTPQCVITIHFTWFIKTGVLFMSGICNSNTRYWIQTVLFCSITSRNAHDAETSVRCSSQFLRVYNVRLWKCCFILAVWPKPNVVGQDATAWASVVLVQTLSHPNIYPWKGVWVCVDMCGHA